jgi:hypothetical protein
MRRLTRSRVLGGILAIALFALVASNVLPAGGTAGAENSSAPDGVAEGISVRGDWSIGVYDIDGSVVSETDFSNHLSSSGARSMIDLL